MDWLHAWREWLAGHDTRHLVIQGTSILWWGRVGKVLELLGAVTVAIDLAGPTHMEQFRSALTARRSLIISVVKRKSLPKAKIGEAVFTILACCVSAALIVAGQWLKHHGQPWRFFGYLLVYGGAIPASVVAAGVLVSLVVSLLAVPLGETASADKLGISLKWFGFWALLLGFSMDLLSS